MRLSTALGILALAAAGGAAPAAFAAGSPGQTTFMENCSACHQVTGLGIKGAFPALAGSKLVNGPAPVMIATVLNGRAGMPAFKSDLTDAQLAGAITYVRGAWGNKASAVTPGQVMAVRNNTKAAPKAKSVTAH